MGGREGAITQIRVQNWTALGPFDCCPADLPEKRITVQIILRNFWTKKIRKTERKEWAYETDRRG